MRLEQVIRRPLLSEKVMEQKETQNIVAFEVDSRANKIEVKQAVEAQFKDVEVEDVRILRGHGKVRRQGRWGEDVPHPGACVGAIPCLRSQSMPEKRHRGLSHRANEPP